MALSVISGFDDEDDDDNDDDWGPQDQGQAPGQAYSLPSSAESGRMAGEEEDAPQAEGPVQ